MYENLTDYVNIGKKSAAAKVLFQKLLVATELSKTEFFSVSIAKETFTTWFNHLFKNDHIDTNSKFWFEGGW